MYSAWGTYGTVLGVHSVLRWLVVLAAVVAVVRALIGRVGGRDWTAADTLVGRVFVVVLDLQVAIGFVIYGLYSAVVRSALTNPGLTLQTRAFRFWVLEHPIAMLTAVALAHVGLSRAKTATGSLAQRHAFLFFGLALIVILAAIPWPFFTFGRALWPLK